jgi:hypothetical protein
LVNVVGHGQIGDTDWSSYGRHASHIHCRDALSTREQFRHLVVSEQLNAIVVRVAAWRCDIQSILSGINSECTDFAVERRGGRRRPHCQVRNGCAVSFVLEENALLALLGI